MNDARTNHAGTRTRTTGPRWAVALAVALVTVAPPLGAGLQRPTQTDPLDATLRELGPTATLAVRLWTPEYVHAGNKFHVALGVRLEGPGLAVVKIEPVPPPASGPCSLVGFTVSAAFEMGANTYLMTNSTLPGLPDPHDPPGGGVIGTPYVGLDLVYDTPENVTGMCEVHARVEDLLTPEPDPMELTGMIPVVPMPPTPVDLGHVKTVGGNDVVDQGLSVVPPLLDPVPIVVVTSDPRATLEARISHTDGMDVGDYGLFRFYVNDARVYSAPRLHEETTGAELMTYDIPVPHQAGTTTETRVCVTAQYVDGGLWDTYEEPIGENCTTIQAIEDVSLAHAVARFPELCLTAQLPTTQMDVHRHGTVLEPGAGRLMGSLVALDQALIDWCSPPGI